MTFELVQNEGFGKNDITSVPRAKFCADSEYVIRFVVSLLVFVQHWDFRSNVKWTIDIWITVSQSIHKWGGNIGKMPILRLSVNSECFFLPLWPNFEPNLSIFLTCGSIWRGKKGQKYFWGTLFEIAWTSTAFISKLIFALFFLLQNDSQATNIDGFGSNFGHRGKTTFWIDWWSQNWHFPNISTSFSVFTLVWIVAQKPCWNMN